MKKSLLLLLSLACLFTSKAYGGKIKERISENNKTLGYYVYFGTLEEIENYLNDLNEETKDQVINTPNKYGKTPLSLTTELLEDPSYCYLRENIENFKGIPGCENTRVTKARLLIKHGADVNIKTNMEYSPLYIAITKKTFDIAKVLIEAGANIKELSKENKKIALTLKTTDQP